MGGEGPKYERLASVPVAKDLLLEERKERIQQVVEQRTRTLTVVLDKLEDTFNMAAVVRTCEGMGIQELHLISNPKAPFRPNDKVTQGCDKWIELYQYGDFAACRTHLKSRGFSLWASALQPAAQDLFSMRFDSKVALIFGNERGGVSDEAVAGADGLFWIPMQGFTRSLNISAAVSACLTRAVSWRIEHLGRAGDLTPQERQTLLGRFEVLSVKQRKRIYNR